MMKKVFKYELAPFATSISAPAGAKVLSVKAIGDGVALWAEVMPSNRLESLGIKVVCTGEGFDSDGYSFIDTVVMDGGSLVFHVYVEIKGEGNEKH